MAGGPSCLLREVRSLRAGLSKGIVSFDPHGMALDH